MSNLTMFSVIVMVFMMVNWINTIPQGRLVSQDVSETDTGTDDQFGGRGDDQWWRNYEVVEDHLDDLDDHLEMLYMYSVNPLQLATVTTSRPQTTTKFPSSSKKPFHSKSRSTFAPIETSSSNTDRPTRWTPGFNFQSQSTDGLSDERELSSIGITEEDIIQRTQAPVDRIRTLSDNILKSKSFIDIPKKTVAFQKTTDATFDPRPEESEPVLSTFLPDPQITSPKVTHTIEVRPTVPTFVAASTVHPFIVPKAEIGQQRDHPRYAKLLNRYSLLETVNKDLNVTPNDLTSENPLGEQSIIRQERNDYQPSSARSFEASLAMDEVTTTKRQRRRRPKTSTASVVDESSSAASSFDVEDEKSPSKRPISRLHPVTSTTEFQQSRFISTTSERIPPTPSTSSPATIDSARIKDDSSKEEITQSTRHGRARGRFSLSTASLPISSTTSSTTIEKSQTLKSKTTSSPDGVSESFRIRTSPRVMGRPNVVTTEKNDPISSNTEETFKPRGFRPRTQKSNQNLTTESTSEPIIESKSKSRATSLSTRRPISSTTDAPITKTAAGRKIGSKTTPRTISSNRNVNVTVESTSSQRPFGITRPKFKSASTTERSNENATAIESQVGKKSKQRIDFSRPQQSKKQTSTTLLPDITAEQPTTSIAKKFSPRGHRFRTSPSSENTTPQITQTTEKTISSLKPRTVLIPKITTSPLVPENVAGSNVTTPLKKRRRRPVKSKKSISSYEQMFAPKHPPIAGSDVPLENISITTPETSTMSISTPEALIQFKRIQTPGLITVALNSTRPMKRRKLKRRKLSQRSTISGQDGLRLLNVTIAIENDLPTTSAMTATTNPVAVTESIVKPTTEKTKKTSFVLKFTKDTSNNTNVKDGKMETSSAINLESKDEPVTLQAEESGDSTWFSSASNNGGDRVNGGGGLFNVEEETGDDGKSWFGMPDEINQSAAESSPQDVKIESNGGIDARPLLISRISEGDDLMEESASEETSSTIRTEEEIKEIKPKQIQKSRTATFSVSSSISSSEDSSDQKSIAVNQRRNEKETDDQTRSTSDTMATTKKSKIVTDEPIRSTAEGSNNDQQRKSSVTSPRTRTRSSSKRTSQSTTSSPESLTTTEETTTIISDESSKPPASDTAVSYFGEEEMGGPVDIDIGAEDSPSEGEEDIGAVESSYDPDSGAEEQEGVLPDGVIEHSDPNEDSSHPKVPSEPMTAVVEDRSSSVDDGLWGFTSPLSDSSEPIKVSSSINIEVLSRAPKQMAQTTSKREAKSSRSGLEPEVEMSIMSQSQQSKTRSRQILRNILKAASMDAANLRSSREERNDDLINTTKRNVSTIKSAEDIAQLFHAVTNVPMKRRRVEQRFQPPSKAAILMINRTLINKTSPSALVITSEDDVRMKAPIRLVVGPTNCTKLDRNICPKSEGYPSGLVDSVVKEHGDTLNHLWNELQADETNTRINFPEEQERKKDELSVCDSSIEQLQPGWARDAVTGKWMIIINTAQYPQIIRIESCQRPKRECLFISPYYRSTCVEHYSVHRLVAIYPDVSTDGNQPTVGIFKFPCGCSCKVEMFLGQSHNNN